LRAWPPHKRASKADPSTLFTATDLRILARLNDGLTQAEVGAELRLEQASISRLLHAAERRSGLQLLQPGGRRVRLTSVGRELAEAGERALRQLRGLDRFAASLRAGRAGSVRIIASSTPGSYLLPGIVARFLQRNPAVNVELAVETMSQLWEQFMSGGFDFAVTPRLAYEADVVVTELCDDPIVLFVAAGTPLAGRLSFGHTDFADHMLVGKFSDSYWGQITRELGRRGYRFARRIDLRSSEAVKQTVQAGLGIGLLFASSVRDELAEGTLVRLPVVEPLLQQRHCIVRRTDTDATPLAQELVAFLRDALDPGAPS
jgi:DNA-binding transcriptional LysR family regulator